jgi:hypothetical protein
MVPAISVTAVLLLLAGRAMAQLDLSPRESFYEVEGIRVPNVKFRNGPKDVFYTPPSGWRLSGGGQKLALIPPDISQAGASIEVQPTKDPVPAQAGNIDAYRDSAVALLPGEATKVEVIEACLCPLRISGRAMVEVTLAYVLFGQPFRTNVLFMPVDSTLIRFQINSRSSDYPRLHGDFQGSLYSMRGF